jgi:anaerobic selenocysteine-containing dehydrogenase
VTLDPFMSATAQLAHYVIAPKLTLETPGMSQPGETGKYYGTGMGIPCAYAQVAPRVVEPPENSDLIEEWQFFHGIARRLSLDLTIGVYYGFGPFCESPPLSFSLDQDELITTEELHEKMCQTARIPFAEVAAHPHGHIWPVDDKVQAKEPAHRGKLLIGDKTMMTELGSFLQLDTSADNEFPFRLVSRRTNTLMNSSGHNIAKLKGEKAYNPAWLHSQDLRALNIQSGDTVRIRSRHNEILAIAESDDTMRPGVISMSHAFGGLPEQEHLYREIGSNTGKLLSVDVDYDPYSGMPRIGNLPVSVSIP